jgi:hypothetical protein
MTQVAPPRIDWGDRQQLAGRDLRAAEAFLDARRARHVRGAHRTWGVALGLDLLVSGTPPAVIVGPGLAYDARGRELLVQQPTVVAGSAAALAGKQPVAVALRSLGERCVPGAWARVPDERVPLVPGRDVPLGRVNPTTGDADQRGRAHVATLAAPRVRSGLVGVGGVQATRVLDHLRAKVDTSQAGFATTPFYLVEPIVGPGSAQMPRVLLAVTAATPTDFIVQVRRSAAAAAALAALSVPISGGLPFALAWIGVEPAPSAGVLAADLPPCPCIV